MWNMVTFIALAFASSACAADDGKAKDKRHDYDPAKLPSVVKVKAGESIVVTYKIKPEDVEETKASSDKGDVTVKGEAGKASFQIVIRSDKKGKAKINWEIIQVNGRVEGWKDLEVEFE
jgi:hypothetical protein